MQVNQKAKAIEGNVLLVEDDPDTQMMVRWILQSEGAKVTTANNGQECLDKVKSAQDSGTDFDVILLDVQMPVLDGLTAAKMLREDGYKLPIVALTAGATAEDEKNSLQSGFDDHICKLAARDELVARIEKYLEKDAHTHASEVPILPIMPTVIDEDPKYAGLILAFLDRLPGTVNNLKEALEREDWDGLKGQLVSLGSAELFGYHMLTNLVKDLQKTVARKDPHDADLYLVELCHISERMIAGREQIAELADVFGGLS